MKWILYIILFITALIFFVYQTNKQKRKRLMIKYNDENLVQRLMLGQFWQGQTSEQLTDSLGRPNDKSIQVLKSKTKETWKYQKTGTNRYALKIFIEDGIVIGWDQK